MRSSHRRPDGCTRWRAGVRPVLAASVVAVLAAGCAATAPVKSTPAAKFDASAYRTYQWGTPVPVLVANEDRERDAAVLEWTIRDAIDRTLTSKGYQRIEAGDPDFEVDFGVRLEEKSTDTFGEYITYRDAGGQQNLGGAYVFGYEEGALVIEATDARSETRLWTGSERVVLDDGQDVKKLEQATARILAGFPGRPGSGSNAVAPATTSGSTPTRKPSEPKRGDFYVPEP